MGTKPTATAALLKLMVRAGVVTPEQAQAAEIDLLKEPGSVLDWLTRNGFGTEEALAHIIATQLQLPYVNLAAQALSAAVINLVEEEQATRGGIVPLRAPDGNLVVAMANPLDRDSLRLIEIATGRRLHIEVATQTAVRDALEHAYHLDDVLNTYLQRIPEGAGDARDAARDGRQDYKGLLRETTLPPVVKLLNLILMEGLRSRASDIHIEPSVSGVRVRLRVDGLLEESFRLPKWIQNPLTARCKVLARLDIAERRVPQEGRATVHCHDHVVDLRVSTVSTQFGEKLMMHVVDPRSAPDGLGRFGLTKGDLKVIRQAITRPEGMVLVAGPTGSGKTTTLYGMLAELIAPSRSIVSIESPIEHHFRGVHQVEIDERQGLTFAHALRSILRQDPDVILVGEIRDSETAEIALRAAQTGHLVLSTLAANDAASSVTRLLDLGIEPYMLASSLLLVVAQRLVRRTCERCAEPSEPAVQHLEILHIEGPGRFVRGRGCGACRKTGFAGRRGVFEVMPVTRRMSALIERKAGEATLRAQARDDGMETMFESAAQLVCDGISVAEEVLRVVDVDTERAHCPACEKVIEENFALCPHCATPLRGACTSCGMQLQKEWQLCPYCGSGIKPAGAAVENAAPLFPPEAPPAALVVPARTYRALIVDDQPDMRLLAARALQSSDLPISVIEAVDGLQALARAEQELPDLILLDIMMPGMDGFAVCERLRANVRTAFIPILMLTARDDADSRARGFMAGTDDYISKPFARAELLARVRRLVERTYGSCLPPPVPAASRTTLQRGAGTGAAQLSA